MIYNYLGGQDFMVFAIILYEDIGMKKLFVLGIAAMALLMTVCRNQPEEEDDEVNEDYETFYVEVMDMLDIYGINLDTMWAVVNLQLDADSMAMAEALAHCPEQQRSAMKAEQAAWNEFSEAVEDYYYDALVSPQWAHGRWAVFRYYHFMVELHHYHARSYDKPVVFADSVLSLYSIVKGEAQPIPLEDCPEDSIEELEECMARATASNEKAFDALLVWLETVNAL